MTDSPQYMPTVRPTAPADTTPISTSAYDPDLPTSFAPKSAQNGGTRAARLRRRLGDRDLAVLASLRQFKLLTGNHVQRLHVADSSEKTRARRARAIVKRLVDLGLVVRLGRNIGGVRAGSEGHTLGLTGLGDAVLDVGGAVRRRHRHTWEGKPYFQDHTLTIADFYVGLREHVVQTAAELIAFETEPTSWRRFAGINGGTVLKPDCFVRLGVGEFERLAFVEIDLGTESLPSVMRKNQSYISYWRTGLEQRQHELFPGVLWLVPDERRSARLAEGIRQLPEDAQALFTVALLRDAPTLLTTKGGWV